MAFQKGHEGYWKGKKRLDGGIMKGKKHSKETKKKISATKKGTIPWNKGIVIWDTRKHPNKGKKIWENKEHPRGMLGKKNHHSEESRRKISESNMGRIISTETRNKISNTLKKYYDENPKTKEKISKDMKEYYIVHPEAIERIKKARAKQKIPKKDSSIELKLQTFLRELEIEFYTHQYMKIEHGYQCDIFIPYLNLIIEADGDYFHSNPKKYSEDKLNKRQVEQKERDSIRTKELLDKGYNVMRIWEDEIREMNVDDLKNKLMEVMI